MEAMVLLLEILVKECESLGRQEVTAGVLQRAYSGLLTKWGPVSVQPREPISRWKRGWISVGPISFRTVHMSRSSLAENA